LSTNTDAAVGGPRHLLRVLARRRYTILLVVGLLVVPVVSFSVLQSPVYAARSRVLLQAVTPDALVNSRTGAPADPARARETQVEVFSGEPLRALVQSKIGSTPPITARGVRDTDLIEVTARDKGAKRAATIVDAYADAYVELRRTQAVDTLVAAGQQVQARLSDAEKKLDDIEARIAAAPAADQRTLRQSPERAALVAQVTVLRQKLDNLQLDQSLNTGGAEVGTHAQVPTDPESPRPVRAGLWALAVGLVLGIGAAFLQEYLDDSVKTRDELGRLGGGRPVLGAIPVVPDLADSTDQIISLRNPHSPAAEAYRSLRTSIQFLSLDTPVVTIEVTSPSPREGKTTTVANLGVAMARAGQRVVIVGCDLRRPIIHEFFGLDGRFGLTSVILGKAPLSAVLQTVPGQNRLSVLPSGPVPPNPAEILSSWRFAEVLSSLQQNADVVLIDSPPVLPVTDAMVLSGRVDATVLVALSGVTARQEVTRAVELLAQVGAPIVGTVLNGIHQSDEYGAGFDYYRTSERRGNAAAST